MTHQVFVYGTLLKDEVVSVLTGVLIPSMPATLPHHRRLKIHKPGRDAKGPAIIKSPSDAVHGRILFNVDDRCLQILDQFELAAGGYKRVQAKACAIGNRFVTVETYRAKKKIHKHLFGDWCLDEFERLHMAHYVNARIPALIEQWRAEGLYPEQ